MKAPLDLELKDWWKKAACLGKHVELINKRDCYGCPVQWECLWTAITEDDRVGDHVLFVRGGLPANRRERLWWKYNRDPLRTFVEGKIEAEGARLGKKRR